MRYNITISTLYGRLTVDNVEADNEEEAFEEACSRASFEVGNHAKMEESHEHKSPTVIDKLKNLFKSEKDILLSKIKPDNLKLLDEEDRESEYCLKRLLAWQEEYSDDRSWEEFEEFGYCERCSSWMMAAYQCICYAR
jgi:hypothetical protein